MIPDPEVGLTVTTPSDAQPASISPDVAFDPRPESISDAAPIDRHIVQ